MFVTSLAGMKGLMQPGGGANVQPRTLVCIPQAGHSCWGSAQNSEMLKASDPVGGFARLGDKC